MPDEAVLDAPVTDSSSTVDSTSADTTSSDGLSGVDSGGSPESIDNADSPQSGEINQLRGKELYRAVKEKLKAALTVDEQRALRNAIHIAAQADEYSGGDLTKFQAERSAYQQLALEGEESLTPEDLVQTVRMDREQLQGILNDIASGAPKLLDEMLSDHPESFKSLVPQAMDRLAEVDNERFSNYVAKSAVNYLQSQGIDVQFAMIDAFLPAIPQFPGKEQLIEAIKSIYGSVSGLKSLAAKQIGAPNVAQRSPGDQNGNQGGDLDAREQNITRYEWNRTAGQANVSLRDSEMTRAAGTRKVTLTDAEKSKIQTAVKEEFETRLAANRNYGQAMQGYLKNKNQRAYNERAASEGQKLLPSIVARHTNAVIDERTKAQAAARPATNGNVPRGTQPAAKDGNGNLIQWLSGAPKSVGKQVDHMRTTRSMLAQE